ncbi:hypothetical protein D3C85_937690 [compost metagenome]
MALDLVSVSEKNLARIHEWIRSVDQKLSILLTFQGVFITLVVPLTIGILSKHLYHLTSAGVGFVVAGYLLMAYGILKSIRALYSTLKVKKSIQLTEDQLSLTYFKHIDDMSLAVYEERMRKLRTKSYIKELLAQIKVSAKITTRKQILFNDALFFFFSGALLLALALIISGYFTLMG